VIDQVLDFLRAQLDEYLRLKLDPSNSNPFVQLANIAWHDTESAAGAGEDKSSAFITLINIEEDRISKSQENFVRRDNVITYKNPKIYLNLYLLFSVNLNSYPESLKRLSFIIQFFQYKNVFTSLNSPGLPANVNELILDLYTISFQDLNNLWGILGAKYLPSVMYKLRLITISEEFAQGEAGLLREIVINDKSMQPS
jgi:hypothetical protein